MYNHNQKSTSANMNASTLGAPTAPPRSHQESPTPNGQLASRLGTLDSLVSELHTAIEHLRGQLGPVLDQTPATDTPPTITQAPFTALDCLDDLCRRSGQQIAIVRDLQHRLVV